MAEIVNGLPNLILKLNSICKENKQATLRIGKMQFSLCKTVHFFKFRLFSLKRCNGFLNKFQSGTHSKKHYFCATFLSFSY